MADTKVEEPKKMVAIQMVSGSRTVAPGVTTGRGSRLEEGHHVFGKAFSRVIERKAYSCYKDLCDKHHPFYIENASDEVKAAEIRFRPSVGAELDVVSENAKRELEALKARQEEIEADQKRLQEEADRREQMKKEIEEEEARAAAEKREAELKAELEAEVKSEKETKAALNPKPSGRK